MAARTGREFLAGLKAPREIWVGDEKVSDVTSHPAFAGAAQTMAELFDLQHEAADVLARARARTTPATNDSNNISPYPVTVTVPDS